MNYGFPDKNPTDKNLTKTCFGQFMDIYFFNFFDYYYGTGNLIKSLQNARALFNDRDHLSLNSAVIK